MEKLLLNRKKYQELEINKFIDKSQKNRSKLLYFKSNLQLIS